MRALWETLCSMGAFRHRVRTVPKSALIVVLGAFVACGSISREVGCFAVLASLLWLGLYILNEVKDCQLEAKRTIEKWVTVFSIILIVLANATTMLANPTIGAYFFLMTAGQLAYSCPPFRLKRFVWAGLVLTGIVNPSLRFVIGYTLADNLHTKPMIVCGAYLLLITLHLSWALKMRINQAERDRHLGYQYIPLKWALYCENLQYLTPFWIAALIWLLRNMAASGLIWATLTYPVLAFATLIDVFFWFVNDIYDLSRRGRPSEPIPDMSLARGVFYGRLPEGSRKPGEPRRPIISATLLATLSLIATYLGTLWVVPTSLVIFRYITRRMVRLT